MRIFQDNQYIEQFEAVLNGNSSFCVLKLMGMLTKQEKEILYYTFIKQYNQKDTGNLVGISQMHVSRIQRRALQKLRKASDSKMET